MRRVKPLSAPKNNYKKTCFPRNNDNSSFILYDYAINYNIINTPLVRRNIIVSAPAICYN